VEKLLHDIAAFQLAKSLYLGAPMKMIFLVAIILAGLALNAVAADAGAPKKGTVKHMVAFKFKDSATPDDIKKVETEFKALKKKIKEINSFAWGLNNSPEKLNKGFTHGFLLTFNSEADRDTYLNHPDHKEFAKLVTGLLADVFVLDFTAGK
jgi:hypothetical protein